MTNNETSDHKVKYLSYRDDNERTVSGYFDILEESPLFIKFRTKNNIVTISMSRVIKIKETSQ